MESREPSAEEPQRRWRYLEVIQRQLETAPLFMDCQDDSLRDLYTNSPKVLRCQNRTELMDGLSFHLQYYEYVSVVSRHLVNNKAACDDVYKSLYVVADALHLFFKARVRDKLSLEGKNLTKGLQKNTAFRALDTVALACCALEPQHFGYEAKDITRELSEVAFRMTLTFAWYGPADCQKIIYNHAIAGLLNHFKLEDGTPDQIRRRVEQRISRLPKTRREELTNLFRTSPHYF